jgi:type II secretory pathway component PulJ
MSLHEMLVALAVCGIVFGGAYATLDAGVRAYAIGAARAESQQAARVALNRLAREIRVTGVGADSDMPAIVMAESAEIVLGSDLDADGVFMARGERITWRLATSILRRDAGGGAQPIANGVHGFVLRYLDAAGEPTSVPAAVRTVEVTMRTGTAAPESSLARGVGAEFATRARLRNR